MKQPVPPPSLETLLDEVHRQGRGQLVQLSGLGRRSDADYLPWDKLRFKTPPQGLCAEEFWLQTRLARHASSRELTTLVDCRGQPFSFNLPDTVLRQVERIARDASGNISISEQVTDSATRDRYIVSSLIEEAITSSQLEGAATTRKVAKDLLRSGRSPRDNGERMIVNNYRAMERIRELAQADLTPALVCELHRIVTEGTLKDPEAAGRVQSLGDERIGVYDEFGQLLHDPPPVEELPDRLRSLCAFANDKSETPYLPAVLRAITVHFMVGYDHYFEDGNGRTARALFYWAMLRNGYWLTEFLTISRILRKAPAQYGRAFLLTEQDGGDLTHFFVHQLGVIARAIDDLVVYLEGKQESLRTTSTFLRASPGEFNHRQLALMRAALQDHQATFTVVSHANSHAVSPETARQDLMELEARGHLVRFKIGRQFAWQSANSQ